MKNASLQKKIIEELMGMMMGWRHSGFNVYCGLRTQPSKEEAIEDLARYIIRPSFSQEGVTYTLPKATGP
jgi:hypothetical protein